MGFDSIDFWIAHLHPDWATDEHLKCAKELLEKHQLTPISMAGGFGQTADELVGFCRVASSIGCEMLGGGLPFWHKDPDSCISILKEYGIKWAFENHPNEKTAEDVINIIGNRDEDLVGVACDTGWFGTNACDGPAALRELAPRLMHIHLKDVREAGQHRTCQLGDGVVNIPACVEVLQQVGYTGPIAIEHEPEEYDPNPEVEASLKLLRSWLQNPCAV